MCGIVGVFNFSWNGLSLHQEEMFQQMLYCNAVRGMHGTGMLAVDEKGNFNRIRVGGPPHQLFGTSQYKDTFDFIRKRYIRFLVGHNRYATKGKHITEHAHPFRDGHIVLVHNGTLENYKHLPDSKKYEVDSELLCHAIAVQGIEEVIPNLQGAWTLVWWDNKAKTMNILRNEERPLYMAVHEGEKMVAIASEEQMLTWVMNRNHYYSFKVDEVAADRLLTFSLDDMVPKSKVLAGRPTKKNKQYYETLFTDAKDACSTSCSSASDTEITVPNGGGRTYSPPAASSGSGADWSRGKTGQVMALPAPKGNGGKSSNNSGKKSWRSAEFLHEISKGDLVTCRIVDFDTPDDKAADFFIVRCLMEEYPDIEFRCHVRGESLMDKLYGAKYGIRAVVTSIQKSDQQPAVNPHRIFLHNPEPADVWTPKSGAQPTKQ